MDQFKSLVESGQVQLVCNMANAEYISSSGLRALLGTLKKTRTQQGDLRLACLPSCVKEVLDMAGFTQLFKIFPTEEEAINSLKQ